MNDTDKGYLLEMKNVTKAFFGVKALDNVTFQVKKGEIHGLIGENGAGKSTLIKILAGIYSMDSGSIFFEGTDISDKISPRTVGSLGISFIHQERYIVPNLTVAEMLFLGNEKTVTPFKFMRRKEMEKAAEKFMYESMGVSLSGSRHISELSVGEKQLVMICKALLSNPKVIVFDEPTAVIPKKDVDKLFQVIKQLRRDRAIIYISHYFKEILELCDEVTVLRNGKKITTVGVEGMTVNHLVSLMIGRDVASQYPKREKNPGDVLLRVEHLSGANFSDVSFEIRSGEILGLTGLIGSGHEQVGLALYNSRSVSAGTVCFNGKTIRKSVAWRCVDLGIGYVPEDRRGLGLLQLLSVKENTSISNLRKISKYGVIRKKLEEELTKNLVKRLGIKTRTINTQCQFLSGGNQQKVVLAKWLNSDARLYILNQPTSGVDVGARAEIYTIIARAVSEGAAVLLITQDIQELYNMSDRVITMYRGKVVMRSKIADCTDEEIIVSIMGGETNA